MKPVPVAQVVYSLALAGSELIAWRLARALNATGQYACSMYATALNGPLSEFLAAEGIPHHVYRRRGRLDVRLILQMARQLRTQKIHLVHTHHLGQLLYGALAARLVGAKVVHTEHDYYSLQPHRSRRLLRVLSGAVQAVTAVSESVTRFLQEGVGIPSAKLKTIRNGVQVDRFRLAVPYSRRLFGWDDHDRIIGCVARLEPEKGHLVLLEAFRRLRPRYPDARLLLIGDGAHREALQAVAADSGLNGCVRFIGLRQDIPELIATCDVMTLASYNEGLPMAVLEAMAAGKPVVATRVGAIPELLGEGVRGLVVPPGDPEAMTEALERLIADDATRARLGTASLQLVQNEYSFDQTLAEYHALYQQVLCG